MKSVLLDIFVQLIVYIHAEGSDEVLAYVYGWIYDTNNTRLPEDCGSDHTVNVVKYGFVFIVPSLRLATCHHKVPKYVVPFHAFSLFIQTVERYFLVLSMAKLLEFHHPSSLLAASFHVVAQTTHVVFRGVL